MVMRMKHALEQDGELCKMCQYSRYDEPIPHHVEFECIKGFWLCWDDEQEAEDCEYFKADKWRDNDD